VVIVRTLLRVTRRRVLQAVPTLLGVVAICFLLVKLAPGDLADVMAAEGMVASPEVLERMRALYGLDVPGWQQLLNYLGGILRFDLGYSHRHNLPVLTVILERLPASLLLMLAALGVAATIGIAAGIVAAVRVRTVWDDAISVLAVAFFATPSFWLSLMMVVVFSVKLGLFPVAGMMTIGAAPAGMLGGMADILWHLALPALALGVFYAAIYARVMRASMLQVLDLDYVRTARAAGVAERRIVMRHAFRNAVLPLVTLVGIQFSTVFAGAVVVESVFSWPGLGTLLLEAVSARNYPLVMGVVLFSAVVVTLANLAVDLLYTVLDPRVELR